MQPLVGGRAGMAGPGMAGGLAGAPAAGMFGRPGPWSSQDDHLLVAIVTEFSQNWHLVADVLRSASSMSGVFRRFDVCKQRYSLLLRMSLGVSLDSYSWHQKADERSALLPCALSCLQSCTSLQVFWRCPLLKDL
eukprot:177131-Pelagomonas_calceolata.AAC.3